MAHLTGPGPRSCSGRPHGVQGGRGAQTLVIRDERVAGTLPASYPQALPSLQVLSLSGLLLTGTLPAAWADWGSLRQLALYSNHVRTRRLHASALTLP
jgi:hypothetical protein